MVGDKLLRVSECFYSIQGEGPDAGRPALFIRFAGCNQACSFCDQRTSGPPKEKSFDQLLSRLKVMRLRTGCSYVVLTGGEPLLQVDYLMIHSLKKSGFEVAIETNGTIKFCTPDAKIIVSPKVWPQHIVGPYAIKFLVGDGKEFWQNLIGVKTPYPVYLQPVWDEHYETNLQRAIDLCLRHPTFRLGLQIHKIVGRP